MSADRPFLMAATLAAAAAASLPPLPALRPPHGLWLHPGRHRVQERQQPARGDRDVNGEGRGPTFLPLPKAEDMAVAAAAKITSTKKNFNGGPLGGLSADYPRTIFLGLNIQSFNGRPSTPRERPSASQIERKNRELLEINIFSLLLVFIWRVGKHQVSEKNLKNCWRC